jgi:hypothetical protein
MMRSFVIYSLLLTAVSADIDHDGTCSAIDSLQDRRDTESVRAIVATVSVVVVVLPFLPLAMGANAQKEDIRSPISTYIRRLQRRAYRASDLHRENLWSTSIYDVLREEELRRYTVDHRLYVVVSNSDV